MQETLRGKLYDKIAELGPAWFAGERTGGVMLSVVDGVEQLQSFFGQFVPQASVAALTPIAIFAFIVWWDAPVALVMLVAALVTLIAPASFHAIERRTGMARQQAMKGFGSEFLDAVQGLPTLKAFGQSTAYGSRLAERARLLSDTTMRVLSTSVMTRGITDAGIAIGAAAALALGVWRVSHGLMTIEALLIVLMAGTEVFRPLRDLRSVLHQGMVGQSAAAGIHALLAGRAAGASGRRSPSPSPACGRGWPRRAEAGEGAGGEAAARPLTPTLSPGGGEGVVGCPASPRPSNSTMCISPIPAGGGPAHDGLSFTVAAGEKIGIVGPSGSGKSSVARLLLRLFDPQSGAVRVGGHDLRDARPGGAARADRGRASGHVPVPRHGRGESAARQAGRDAGRDSKQAARDANAHEFIPQLPQGYSTIIGERGVNLSGGQRQRLAIARALLRDSPILILDEALSSVDAENEAVIQQALDRLAQGRTTLILAHRLSSVIGADRILVLDHGRVVESGRHAELIRRDGPYRRLMGAQAEERGDDLDLAIEEFAAARGAGARRPITARRRRPRSTAKAAQVGALATLAHAGRDHRAVAAAVRRRRRPRGSLRVAAFIGVGIAGALAVAAVKTGAPFGYLLILLGLLAPVAGILHWIESWLAHDIAYRLLAEMRIGLYNKLDSLAPAYLVRRRSGDLIALASQDIETIEYFFAHTVAPALVAVLVPATVLLTLAFVAWPIALALLPFVLFAGLAPVLRRARIDRLGAEAREALGLLGAYVTETIQGLSDLVAFQAVGRRRDGFMARGARLSADPAQTAAGPVVADRAARNRDRARRARGRGGRRLDGRRAAARGDDVAAADPAGARLVPADLRDRAGQPPARRHDRLDTALLRRAAGGAGGARRPGAAAGAGRRLGDPLRRGRLRLSRRPAAGARRGRARDPGRRDGRDRRAFGRRQDDARQSAVALLGPEQRDESCIDGVDLREFELDHLRRRISLVSQDTYLFNDTLARQCRCWRGPTPTRRRSGARSTRRRSPISSRACPRGSTPGSASAACNCPAGSGSASRSPAPF